MQRNLWTLIVKVLGVYKALGDIVVVAKDEVRMELFLHPFDPLIAPQPGPVVADQPAVRVAGVVVFAHMVLIRGPQPHAAVLQVDLHHAQARRVARGVNESDSRPHGDPVVAERVPSQLCQI